MDQKRVEEEPVTVLQGDGFYFDRLFLRESSPGQSFRLYYRDAQGVPFQWEMQPGTPKNAPEKEPVPPLTPPPALQGLGLPTPSCVEQPKDSNLGKPVSRLWKRCKKILFSEKFESSDQLCQCDGKFIASANNPSSDSLSSSMPCLDRHPSESPEFEKDLLQGPFVCSPFDITSVDRFLASKIMSRNSSAGQSSHLYYRLAEGVPFTWETMPGKSSEPVQQEAIPPPNPPPAVQGHSLPRPCFEQERDLAPPRLIWFWKRIRINFKLQKSRKIDNTVPLRFLSSGSSGSDRDFVSLPRDSSSSSSSYSSSSSDNSSLLELSRSGKYSRDQSYGCTPWNVRAVLVGLGRRL